MLMGRVRELMNTAFARPPGRKRWFVRFAPELCAGSIYLLLIPAGLIAPSYIWKGGGLQSSRMDLFSFISFVASWAYVAAAFLMVMVPLAIAATTLASERARGTIESLLLTPVDPARLVWGRLLHVALPWMRFMLWMAPVYGLLSSGGWMGELLKEKGTDGISLVTFAATGPKGLVASLFAAGTFETRAELSLTNGIVLLIRWLQDAWEVFLVVALGMHVSARVRTTAQTLIVAFLLVPLVLTVVFSLPEIVALTVLLRLDGWGYATLWVHLLLYPLLSLGGLLFEILMFRRALRLVTWNFVPFATREKAESWWRMPRAATGRAAGARKVFGRLRWVMAALVVLVVAAYSWLVVVPAHQVHAVMKSHSSRTAIKKLGGPAAALRKIRVYLHIPGRRLKNPEKVAWLLGQCGEPAVPLLAEFLKDKDYGVRLTAARALGMTGSSRAVGPLTTALQDPDDMVQGYAIMALGNIGDPRGVGPLISMLNHKDSWARTMAARALGMIGAAAKDAEPALMRALADRSRSVRQAAAEALKKIKAAEKRNAPK